MERSRLELCSLCRHSIFLSAGGYSRQTLLRLLPRSALVKSVAMRWRRQQYAGKSKTSHCPCARVVSVTLTLAAEHGQKVPKVSLYAPPTQARLIAAAWDTRQGEARKNVLGV